MKQFLACEGFCLCQVFVTKTQFVSPKASSKKTDDGEFVSAPLEDMAPFLTKEELDSNMFVD